MANIATNPWSFTNADQAVSKAIVSVVSKGVSALVTTSTAHGLTQGKDISIQGATDVPAYNNGYKVLSVPTATSFYVYQDTPNLAANGANGNVLTVAYPYKPRIEQLVWQKAAMGDTLNITDTNGNPVWQQTAGTVDATYTYGKLYWVDGLVLNAIPSGIVLVTVN
jgi:hypothetical protein